MRTSPKFGRLVKILWYIDKKEIKWIEIEITRSVGKMVQRGVLEEYKQNVLKTF